MKSKITSEIDKMSPIPKYKEYNKQTEKLNKFKNK